MMSDEAFKRYRDKRMNELSGKMVDILSERELIEKTKTLRMVVHFHKPEFKRCQIMDQRLNQIAIRFPSIRFYRVDADMCPVVARKLEIRMLPFLGFFNDGFFVDEVVGFEGLGDDVDVKILEKRIHESNIFKPVSSI